MNIYQRIILILGAIALVVAISTTPKVIYNPKLGYMAFYETKLPLYPQRHFGTVVVRSIEVIGATVLIFFAFKRRSKKGGDRGGKDLQER